MRKITVRKVPCTSFFTPSEMNSLRESLYRKLVAHGTVTVWSPDEDTDCLRLLSSERNWIVDRKKKLLGMTLHESLNDKLNYGSSLGETFPSPFSRNNQLGGETPTGIISSIISSHINFLAKEFISPITEKFYASVDEQMSDSWSWVRGEEIEVLDDEDLPCTEIKIVRIPGTNDFMFLKALIETLSRHLEHRILAKDGGRMIIRSMTAKLWDRIPREPVRIATVCRYLPDSLMITLAWRNLDALREAQQKASFILPIWMRLAVLRISAQFRKYSTRSNEFKLRLIDHEEEKNAIQFVKTFFGINLKPKAWRWMMRKNHLWSQPLIRHFLRDGWDTIDKSAVRMTAVINLFSEIEGDIRLWFYSWFVSIEERTNNIFRDAARYEDNAALLRASAAEAAGRKTRTEREKFKTEFLRIIDWWRSERPQLDHNQRKARWSWFHEKQDKWHEQIRLKQYEENIKPWKTPVEVYREDQWIAFALNSGLSLYREGQFMSNCVYSYQDDCRNGNSLIFHLAQLKKGQDIDNFSNVDQLYEMLCRKEKFTYHATAEISVPRSGKAELWQIETFCTMEASRESVKFALNLTKHIKSIKKNKSKSAGIS